MLPHFEGNTHINVFIWTRKHKHFENKRGKFLKVDFLNIFSIMMVYFFKKIDFHVFLSELSDLYFCYFHAKI